MESSKTSSSLNLENENQNNSKSNFNIFEVKESPFTVIERKEDKNTLCVIALGNDRVSEKFFTSVEEAIQYVDTKPWELILNTTVVLMEKLNNVEQLKKIIENEDKKENES